MISNRCLAHLRRLIVANPKPCNHVKHTRSLATVVNGSIPAQQPQSQPTLNNYVTATVYKFPTMEPLRFIYYPHTHLHLPLRRDILHRAVIYEGDKTRQGSANTKWRAEVYGSHKKVHRQKGLGKARVGDKNSPIRRGGGVAFGPKPRDFSTKLPKKVYDLAWRTALSYRYRKGELLVVDAIKNAQVNESWFLQQIFDTNGWGQSAGKSMFVAASRRQGNSDLFEAMDSLDGQGRLLTVDDVDVKNLLETGRVILEKTALDILLKRHSSDLVGPLFKAPLTDTLHTLTSPLDEHDVD